MSINPFATQHQVMILRHGLATHSKTGYGEQILTAELLPEGIPAIERLGKYLKSIRSQLHYASPVLRCRQTAGILTRESGKFFQFDRRLGEYLAVTGQESFDQFAQRTSAALADILSEADRLGKKEDGQIQPITIIICTHGAVIASLKHLLLEGSFKHADELDYTQPGELLVINNNQSEVISFIK